MKVRLILTSYAFILLFSGYCVLTQKELFPFAPYTMYSNRFDRGVVTEEIRVVLKDRTEIAIRQIGLYGQGRLNSLLSSYFENHSRDEAVHLGSSILTELLIHCRSNPKCRIRSLGTNLEIPASEVTAIKAYRIYYNRLTPETIRFPDKISVLAQTSLNASNEDQE